MASVTETIETENLDTPTVPAVRRPSPLLRALAWVGIAAGSLFIVATVFFSGYVIGQHSGGGGGGGHHGRHAMLIPRPPMGPGGPDGPMMGPDGGPRAERLTPPSPQQPPTTRP